MLIFKRFLFKLVKKLPITKAPAHLPIEPDDTSGTSFDLSAAPPRDSVLRCVLIGASTFEVAGVGSSGGVFGCVAIILVATGFDMFSVAHGCTGGGGAGCFGRRVNDADCTLVALQPADLFDWLL